MSTVNVDCYLIVKAQVNDAGTYYAGKPTVRVAKGKPKVDSKEVAIKINLQLPVSLFIKPQLTANIKIPADTAPFEISAEVQESISNAIREHSGFDVRITVGD